MIRTEEEARKCWCPFARPAMPHNSPFQPGNRMPDMGGDGYTSKLSPSNSCIASECLAWRWAVTDTQSGWVVTRPGNTEPEKDLWGWNPVIDPSTYREGFTATKYVPKVTHGYCGLAGKP
jgi:hypothetical protein